MPRRPNRDVTQGSVPAAAPAAIYPGLALAGDRAVMVVGPVETRLTARECVRLASQLLACADGLFREEDARAPVVVPVTDGGFTTERYVAQADARAARRRARRTGNEIDPNTGLPREE